MSKLSRAISNGVDNFLKESEGEFRLKYISDNGDTIATDYIVGYDEAIKAISSLADSYREFGTENAYALELVDDNDSVIASTEDPDWEVNTNKDLMEDAGDVETAEQYLFDDMVDTDGEPEDFEEFNHYVMDISKSDYNRALKNATKVYDNIKDHLYNSDHKQYLELHDHHTMYELTNEERHPEEWGFFVEKAIESFEENTGVELWQAGRMGRHMVVELNYENAKRYNELVDVCEEMEQIAIDEFNKKEESVNESEEGKYVEPTPEMKIKDWYSALAPEDYQLDKINAETTFGDLKASYDKDKKLKLTQIGDIDSDPRNEIVTAMADLYDLPTNDIDIEDDFMYETEAEVNLGAKVDVPDDVKVVSCQTEDTGGHVLVTCGKLSDGNYFAMSEDIIQVFDDDFHKARFEDPELDGDTYNWENKHRVAMYDYDSPEYICIADQCSKMNESVKLPLKEEILSDAVEDMCTSTIANLDDLLSTIRHTIDMDINSIEAQLETINDKTSLNIDYEDLNTASLYKAINNVKKDLEYALKNSEWSKEEVENESQNLKESVSFDGAESFDELREILDSQYESGSIDDDRYNEIEDIISHEEKACEKYIEDRSAVTNTDYKDEIALTDQYISQAIEKINKLNINEGEEFDAEAELNKLAADIVDFFYEIDPYSQDSAEAEMDLESAKAALSDPKQEEELLYNLTEISKDWNDPNIKAKCDDLIKRIRMDESENISEDENKRFIVKKIDEPIKHSQPFGVFDTRENKYVSQGTRDVCLATAKDLERKEGLKEDEKPAPRELTKAINEDSEEWTEVDHKYVKDSDGFTTDYTMYVNDQGKYVFVFGDKDIYGPEDGDYDWEEDSKQAAQEWFDSYKGPGELDEAEELTKTKESEAKAKETFLDLAGQYETAEEIADALRSLNTAGKLTNAEYDLIMLRWDEWLKDLKEEEYIPDFDTQMEAEESEFCYSSLPSDGKKVIKIHRGESGYYPVDIDFETVEEAKAFIDRENKALGVDEKNKRAMEIGSMFGWNVPGADPNHEMNQVDED